MPSPKRAPAPPAEPAAPPAKVDPSRLADLRAVAADGPLSYSALRWLMFHREANGLARAVVRIGRRTFIDRDRFAEWLAGQREAS